MRVENPGEIAQLTDSPKKRPSTLGQKFPTPKARLDLVGEQNDSPVGESPAFAPRQ